MQLSYIAELLINKIKKDYENDVAVAVIYGSTIYNDTHSRSDLDLFFVPKTERGNRLDFTFILDGIGFDFWSISWERLERIANHDERITSIITEGKVIYCASDADRDRFNEIKKKAIDTSDLNKFLDKASAKLNIVYKDFYHLQKATTLSDIHKVAINIVYGISDVLALLNRTPIKRGRGKLKAEIMNMPLVPEQFSELYDTAFFSSDIDAIKQAYSKLFENTRALFIEEYAKHAELHSFFDALSGFYEELISAYNKIYHACEIGDPVTVLFASVELTNEIEQAFNGTGVSTEELPDLVSAYHPDNLSELCRVAHEHQNIFVEILRANGITLREFKDFDELEAFLASL